MIAGHFGFAAVVKSRAPRTPLWALMLACQWLDVIFVPLFLLGIERIVPVAGTTGGYGDGIIYADYTHSLIGSVLLAALFGAVAAIWWGRASGLVLGGVVFSHWVLDLVVHRADLPILPGNLGHLPRLGFGLWRWHPLSIAIELALVAAGALLYWRAAREVAGRTGQGVRAARWSSGLLLAAGLVTLGLSAVGL